MTNPYRPKRKNLSRSVQHDSDLDDAPELFQDQPLRTQTYTPRTVARWDEICHYEAASAISAA